VHRVASVPEVDVIEHLDSWLMANQERLNSLGYSGSIERGNPEANKLSAWIDVESPRALGQIILWESGEADLRAGTKGSDELTLNEHRMISTREDLDEAMEALLASL
jgi:hypothetical protein